MPVIDLEFTTATGWTDSANAIDGNDATEASVSILTASTGATLALGGVSAGVYGSATVTGAALIFRVDRENGIVQEAIQLVGTVGTSENRADVGADWGTAAAGTPSTITFGGEADLWGLPLGATVAEWLDGLEARVTLANTAAKTRIGYMATATLRLWVTGTRRDVPNAEALNAEADGDALLTFAEVSHPLLSEPLRVVADVLPYVWKGVTWHPVMFEFEAVNDDERTPEARISLPAIDRTIANALIALPERAQISVWVLTSADFDLSVDPRTAIDTPVPLMELLNFDLMDVQGNVSSASGRLMVRDVTQEPYPATRATQSRTPGVFA